MTDIVSFPLYKLDTHLIYVAGVQLNLFLLLCPYKPRKNDKSCSCIPTPSLGVMTNTKVTHILTGHEQQFEKNHQILTLLWFALFNYNFLYQCTNQIDNEALFKIKQPKMEYIFPKHLYSFFLSFFKDLYS